MVRLYRKRSIIVLWTVLLLFCTVAAGMAGDVQTASADPITLVPADSLFYVQINDLTGTLGKLDQFLSGVSPVNTSFLVPMQLARFLGGTEAKGINLAGKFAIFGPFPGSNAPNAIGILVPVSDYMQFAKGNPKVGAPDAQGIVPIGEPQKPQLIAVDVPGFALVTTPENSAALIAMKKSMTAPARMTLSKSVKAEDLKQVKESALWVYVNMQLVSQKYGQEIQAKIQEAQKVVEQAQKKAGQTAPSGNGAELVNSLLPQLDSILMTLDPAPAALHNKMVVTAVPNTELAGIFQGAAVKSGMKFLPYLENDAIVNAVMSVNPAVIPKFYNFYFDMLAKVAGKGIADAEISKWKKIAMDYAGNFTGAAAGSFAVEANSKPPLRMKYVAGIRDPKLFYQSIDQVLSMMNSGFMTEIMKETGLAIKTDLNRNVETYKGVTVDSFRIAFSSTRPGSKEAEALSAIFGQGLEVRFAMMNNLLLYAVAGDSAMEVHKLIDQVKTGGAQAAPAEFLEAMKLIPGAEQSDFFMSYNILRLFQMISALVPNAIPNISTPTTRSIAIAGKMNNGSVSVETALPKEHMMELVNFIMQLQMKQTQGAKL